jgi:phosphate transport system permease protein
MIFFSFIVGIPLVLIIYFVVKMGIGVLNIDFFTTLPLPMGEIGGGILNGLIGTVLIVSLSALMAIPFGISVGVYLSEFAHHKFTKYIRFCAEVLQGVPSIVLGIIAYLWLVIPMKSFSGMAGSVALAIMMLPVIIRSTEETLKMVPLTYKEAALSLGVPHSTTVFRVILPCALNGILTSCLICISRIAGETAPLIFTAFGSPFLNFNMFKSINALPLMIYNYSNSPYPQDVRFAWGIALILCACVLGLNFLSKGVSKRWKVKL